MKKSILYLLNKILIWKTIKTEKKDFDSPFEYFKNDLFRIFQFEMFL